MLFLFFVLFFFIKKLVFLSFSFLSLMKHQIFAADYQPIRNRNWWSKIVSGTVCINNVMSKHHRIFTGNFAIFFKCSKNQQLAQNLTLKNYVFFISCCNFHPVMQTYDFYVYCIELKTKT